MRHLVTRSARLALAALLCVSAAGALAAYPEDWLRDPANPVLLPGDPAAWDADAVFPGTVLDEDGTYRMWYEGSRGSTSGIGQATSTDGRTWVKDPANPVLTPGEWYDMYGVAGASVVLVDGVYHLWYGGMGVDLHGRICHATSLDGIVWTKDPVGLLTLGPPGSPDSQELLHPWVIHEEPLLRMWYNGHDGQVQRILYATSTDATAWQRSATPALEPGPAGDWDDALLGMMCVLRRGAAYDMFYTAADHADAFAIGHASSPDGVVWTKRTPSAPVFGPGPPGSWDHLAALGAVVLPTGTEYLMWYGGTSDFESLAVGLASAQPPTAAPELPLAGSVDAHPNPFNPGTTIAVRLPAPAVATVAVHDLAGRLVRVLARAEPLPAGRHEFAWAGTDAGGRGVASGVYVVRVVTDAGVMTRKVSLAR